MKSVRSRLTVTFIGLIAVILAVIWGVNKWYLEDFYVTKKVQALNAMYTAIDAQIAENKDNGITIEKRWSAIATRTETSRKETYSA